MPWEQEALGSFGTRTRPREGCGEKSQIALTRAMLSRLRAWSWGKNKIAFIDVDGDDGDDDGEMEKK